MQPTKEMVAAGVMALHDGHELYAATGYDIAPTIAELVPVVLSVLQAVEAERAGQAVADAGEIELNLPLVCPACDAWLDLDGVISSDTTMGRWLFGGSLKQVSDEKESQP